MTVERGARGFASADRVMFLQNERGLGVKNGTLGTIEQVSAQSMTVQTELHLEKQLKASPSAEEREWIEGELMKIDIALSLLNDPIQQPSDRPVSK